MIERESFDQKSQNQNSKKKSIKQRAKATSDFDQIDQEVENILNKDITKLDAQEKTIIDNYFKLVKMMRKNSKI